MLLTDFGTKYSVRMLFNNIYNSCEVNKINQNNILNRLGFSLTHKSNPDDITTQNYWKKREYWFKTPTVIKYDESFENVISWGLSALAEKPKKDSFQASSKPVELFKLHLLGSELGDDRPFLPDKLDYKKVIKDYLKELLVVILVIYSTDGSCDFS